MTDYNKKANDFQSRMKKGVDPKASQKGLEAWKAKQKGSSSSSSNSDTVKNARERSKGGQTR